MDMHGPDEELAAALIDLAAAPAAAEAGAHGRLRRQVSSAAKR
jgi:hypothetical protein